MLYPAQLRRFLSYTQALKRLPEISLYDLPGHRRNLCRLLLHTIMNPLQHNSHEAELKEIRHISLVIIADLLIPGLLLND